VSEANPASDAVSSRRPHPGVRPAKGGEVGTARDELLALLWEATFGTRKNFGMYGQIQIQIRDVTPERLTVTISTRNALEGTWLAENVRNAVLNWLQDLLPVERFVAVYDNQERGISGEVYDLPYAQELPNAGALGSSQILIEQNAGPAREELRPRFREAWRRYLEEDKR
jgi:hypothetical protein